MMAVIPRTDFIQGQFAFNLKKSGSYKTHQAKTKKIVSFSEASRQSECRWLLNSQKSGKKVCL